MKNSTCSFLGKIGLVTAFAALNTVAYAATYTAATSGNYTAGATWVGGVAPSTTISGDNIIIPLGTTVTLNQDVMVNGGGSTVTVAGTLNSSGGSDLMVTGNALLTGAGNITVDSLVLGGTSAILGATGNINARAMTSQGLSIASGANLNADESVTLAGGTLALTTGALSLDNNGKIVFAGGTVNPVSLPNITLGTYDVVYTNASATAGAELTGSGLNKVTIAVPSNATVTLGADLTMDDMLTLTSGALDLNGNNLSFTGSGDISAAGAGTISSTAGSDINIGTTNGLTGSLRFTPSASTVGNLGINLGNTSASANLGSDLDVNSTLNLQSGKLNIGANNLTIAAGGSVTNGSANSYIVTGVNGDVTLNIPASSNATFQIGTAANYAPVTVAVNAGSTGGNITAGVNPGVKAGGTVGTNLATAQPVVDATWFVNTDATSNVNMNVQPMWSTGMEVNGFDRTNAYIGANANGTWDTQTGTSATTSGGLHTIPRNNVTTSTTAFAAMDADAVNSVKEIAAGAGLVVYPNPVVNTLYFNIDNKQAQVTIYDITGRIMRSTTGNQVDVTGLAPGYYTVQLSSDGQVGTSRFVKQ